ACCIERHIAAAAAQGQDLLRQAALIGSVRVKRWLTDDHIRSHDAGAGGNRFWETKNSVVSLVHHVKVAARVNRDTRRYRQPRCSGRAWTLCDRGDLVDLTDYEISESSSSKGL